jgi:GTP:adenosylcobinamide-phosphate guanylyltransferase
MRISTFSAAASVQRKLADLNASFDKKDYAAVLAAAPAVLTEAKGLASAAAAKKDEVMKALISEWTGLSASVPQLVTSVKTRVEALSKTRWVPKGVDLAAPRSGLGDATVLWDKAQSAFQSNHVADAVTAAKDAKAKAEAAAAALKMN